MTDFIPLSHRAYEENCVQELVGCADGMSVSSVLVSGAEKIHFSGQPYNTEQKDFICRVMEFLYTRAKTSAVLEALLYCGNYVELELCTESSLPGLVRKIREEINASEKWVNIQLILGLNTDNTKKQS